MSDLTETEYFEGLDGRECRDHRTVGYRAWCFDCSMWCYPHAPCRGCELPKLRKWAVLEETYNTERGRREWRCMAKRDGSVSLCWEHQPHVHLGCGWRLVIPERANPEDTK